MKKIIIVTNHFQNSDGVCKSAIALANYLSTLPDVEITLRPIFKFDKSLIPLLNKNIILKPKYKFYIRGSKRLFKLLPGKLLYKLFVKGKYDIEIGYCLILPHIAIAHSTNKNAKHILWTHGYECHDFYSLVDQIVCVSKENQTRMKEDLANKTKIEYAYNLIDEQRIIKMSEEEFNIPTFNGLTMTSTARMSPEKGFDRLIKAVSILTKEGEKIRLILIGDGPQLIALKQLAKEEKVEDNILFLGEQKNPFKIEKLSDIYICSSYNEGYNTAMVEALILGIPSISTKVGGATEMIEKAKCGVVMDNSLDGIVEELRIIIKNPDLIKQWKEILKTTKEEFYQIRNKEHIKEILKL